MSAIRSPAGRIDLTEAATGQSGYFLLSSAYSERTKHTYLKAVKRFTDWIVESGQSVPSEVEVIDRLLCDYMHHLYVSGKGKADATATLYGIWALYALWQLM